MIDKELLDILACPSCKAPVTLREPDAGDEAEAWLVCGGCGLWYPVKDGIPIMLIEEAERLSQEPGKE